MHRIAFFLATFLGAVVAGFAFGLIASAVWLHIIMPAQSAALIAAFTILIQGATLWNFGHALQIPRHVRFIVGGAVDIPLGATALNWATPTHMRAFIGLALILFSVYSLVRPKLPIAQRGRTANDVVGHLSGLFAAGTGLAGLPVGEDTKPARSAPTW